MIMIKKFFSVALSALLLAGCTGNVKKEEAKETKEVKSYSAPTKQQFEQKYKIVTDSANNKVILDADVTYINDDMYALFELLQADKMGYIKLLGLTAAGGNALTSSVTYDVLSALEFFDRKDIPLAVGTDVPLSGFKNIDSLMAVIGKMPYVGAYSQLPKYTDNYLKAKGVTTTSNLPEPTIKPIEEPAWDFMIRQVNENPGKVTIFAIGGYTNVAKAIQKDPEFAKKAAGIVYMGGVFDVPGEALPRVEINWWYDPEAVNICLNAGWKKQLVIPHDAATTCLKGKDMYDMYKAKNTTKISQAIVDSLAPIYENGKEEFLKFCWDPITVAVYLCPDLIEKIEPREVAIERNMGLSYASCMAWFAGTGPKGTAPCDVVFKVKRDELWDFVSDLYSLQ